MSSTSIWFFDYLEFLIDWLNCLIFYSLLHLFFVVSSIFESIQFRRCLFSSIQLRRKRRTWFLKSSTIETNESWSSRRWSSVMMSSDMWIWSKSSQQNQLNSIFLSFSRLKSTRSIQLICRLTSNVISSFCERIIRIKCVNIKKESTFWRIWTFSYWRQLIDSILFISEIRRRFIKNYQLWRNVSSRRIVFEDSRWFASIRICKKRSNINNWINDCWTERRSMRRQNDWIYLTLRRIDVRTIFSIRCARWICHSCLKKRRFWITRWIRKNLRRH
jgi:hypothetical protein